MSQKYNMLRCWLDILAGLKNSFDVISLSALTYFKIKNIILRYLFNIIPENILDSAYGRQDLNPDQCRIRIQRFVGSGTGFESIDPSYRFIKQAVINSLY